MCDFTFYKKGFKDVESILNEWNYVRKWEEPDDYSARVRLSVKGAAYVAGLMYYDLRPTVSYNGAFSAYYYDLLPG